MIKKIKSSHVYPLHAGLLFGLVLGSSCVQALVSGATPAQFSVSQSGAATYSVPIEVPAGVQGLQPALTLHYSSQAGQGIAGLGWSLDGVSSIKRCAQTLAQDGKQIGISLTATDRFCMDGRRLVLNGPAKAYGADGAIYHTEIDTFARISSVGTTGAGPTSFKVQTKAGLTLEFGGTADSRMLPARAVKDGTQPTTILMWALNKVTDLSGNEVSYKYLSNADEGSQRLESIEYNGGKARVNLSYTPHSNPMTAFVAGTRVTHPVLLSGISTTVLDADNVELSVKLYKLEYEFKDVKGAFLENALARLASLTECGSGSQCRAPVTFLWTGWTSESDREFGFASGLFGLNPKTFESDTTFSTADGWGDEIYYPRRFADMDRDGHLDIIGFGTDGVYVSYIKKNANNTQALARVKVSSEFGLSEWKDTIYNLRPRHLVDFNRDGYPDIVGFNNQLSSNSSHGMYVALWNPLTQAFNAKQRIDSGSIYTSGFGSCGGDSDLIAPKYLVDMNMDGYPDVIGFGKDGIYYSAGNGTSVDTAKLVSSAFRMRETSSEGDPAFFLTNACMGVDRQPIYMEDMNADGYPDVVAVGWRGTFVLLWNPSSMTFGSPTLMSTTFASAFRGDTLYPTNVADMNGDGYPDLVGYRPGGVLVSLWNGVSFNPATYWTSEFSYVGSTDLSTIPRRIVDVNGDGYPDVVNFVNDGVYIAISNGNGKIFPAKKWTGSFPSNSTDSLGNKWGRDDAMPRHALDLDGDGTLDLIGFGNKSVLWSSPSSSRSTRVRQITDSLGSKISIKYTVAQPYSSFYKVEPVTGWPDREVHGPLLVVANVFTTKTASSSLTRETRYRYGGLKSNSDRGSLGFMWVAERDEDTGIETYNEYQQNYPSVGRMVSQRKYKGSLANQQSSDCYVDLDVDGLCLYGPDVVQGQLLGRVSSTVDRQLIGDAGEYAGNGRWFVYEKETVEERWELDGTPLPKTTTTHVYDLMTVDGKPTQVGNLTKKSVVIDGGFNTVLDYSYEPVSIADWNLGLLSSVKTTATRPARAVFVGSPADAALPPGAAPPKPIAPEVLSVILSLLLDD